MKGDKDQESIQLSTTPDPFPMWSQSHEKKPPSAMPILDKYTYHMTSRLGVK